MDREPKRLSERLKRGATLGGVCAAVAFIILFLFQDNLTLGAATAASTVILVYLVLERFL